MKEGAYGVHLLFRYDKIEKYKIIKKGIDSDVM